MRPATARYSDHALLNGDMGYLEYDLTGDEFKQNAEQVKELRKLTERVAMSQMVKHEFLSDTGFDVISTPAA